jgi:hypothetical protein
MPRHALVVRIFVACPSDVCGEREQLEILISEMNRIWSNNYGIVFEVISWQTDVHPAFGADPQSVINSQIADDYDIFLGILWGRFGSKTPRAESGTVEEFQRAYARWSTGHNGPELMVYFKDAALPPSQIDPEAIRKINDFKRQISEKGGLYGTFEDIGAFQTSVRSHLSIIAKKFSQDTVFAEEGRAPANQGEGQNQSDDEEPGLLDFLERYESVMPELVLVLEEIVEATLKMASQIGKRAVEMEKPKLAGSSRHEIRKTVKNASENMETFAKVLEHKIPLFSDLSARAFDALSNALALQADFTDHRTESALLLRQSLTETLVALNGNRAPIAALRQTVSGLPRLTGDINRAKRAVIRQLDAYLNEVSKTNNLIKNVLRAIDIMPDGLSLRI